MRARAVPLIIVLSVLSLTCGRPARPELSFAGAPVILISIDTLRADHLPLYGYSQVATPAIDSIGRDSVTFDNASASCPMTLPSHLTMLTGLLPPEHGVRDNVGFAFDPKQVESLPTVLHERGYATGAAVSSYVLRGETGLAGAFDSYDDNIDPRPGAEFREYQRAGNLTEEAAERWIASHQDKPFFFFLHLYEPHAPYEPVEPFRTRYASRPYDGEIATVDAIIGHFAGYLRRTGLYDRAIIIITSDHGEGLDDHGEAQHSVLVYRELIHVPLIIKLPGRTRAATRVPAPVAIADITPTVLDLVGAAYKPKPHSRAVFPGQSAPERSIYSESYYGRLHFGWSELRSLTGERFHLIASQQQTELYDDHSDPAERSDLSDSNRRQVNQLRRQLASYDAAPPVPGRVDAETARKLEALGYLGAGATSAANGPLPNPRDRIAALSRIGEALRLAAAGNDREAIGLLTTLTNENPRMSEAWIQLAQFYQQRQRPDDALAAYKQALSHADGLPDEIALGMADVYLQKGDAEHAASLAAPVRGRNPRRATMILARIALERGNLDEAQRLVGTTPSAEASPSELVLLAGIEVRRHDFTHAMALLEQARSLAEQRGTAAVYRLDYYRGEVMAQTNHPREALEAFRQEIEHFPTDTMAWSHMAVLEFMVGDKRSADATLEQMVRANPTRQAGLLAASTLESIEDLRGAERWRVRASRLP